MTFGTRAAYIGSIFAIAVSGYVILTPPPADDGTDIAELLNPSKMALTLCGPDGRRHGLFFRPAFAMSLAPEVHAAETGGPPLWDNLGHYSYAVSTQKPEAQAYFDQGLRLVFGFNHGEAVRSFRKARELDPYCAMCSMMEAFALGPNINAAMDPQAVEPAFAAMARARTLASHASEKEQAFIAAMAKRYSPGAGADRAALDLAFADAMKSLHARYPDDQEIALVYAEAEMDVTPWNYWERDLTTPRPRIGAAIAAVEEVLKANPEQPGAIHLYIHLMEASAMPERAEPYADRLGGLMPGAGHIVHMSSHVYFRVGRYRDSLKANIRAVQADEAYLAEAESTPLYRYGYYTHNLHFVVVSAQMAGDGRTAMAYAARLDKLVPMEALSINPFITPIKAAPLFVHAQFGTPEQIAALPDPGADPYLAGIWHYTRALGLVASGNLDAAVAEAEAISAINRPEALTFYTRNAVPLDAILYLAEDLVRARVLQAQGEYDRAVPLLEQAVSLQDSLSYMEPPYWYYPVEQTLGAVYLQAGRTDEAVRAFTRSLLRHPNSAWSLWGLMRAHERAGNKAAAKVIAKQLDQATEKATDISIDRL
jgi:tetratricopeptide (TPR) repeat protein